MSNLLNGITKTLKNKWYIISAGLLILGIAMILIKSNNLTGFRANGAIVTIAMGELNYDRDKLATSVSKIDSNATINYLDSSVNIITTTNQKAIEIFNSVKADFSLTAEEADVSGDVFYSVINFNIMAVLLVIVVCFIFSFIVFCLMLGYKYAFSNLISNIVSIVLVLAVFLILNLPLGMPFISMIFLSIISIFYFDMSNSVIVKDQIKKVKKAVISDIVDRLYENTIESILIVKIVILCSLVVLAIVIPHLRRYALSTFFVILISVYFSYFLTNPLWLKFKEGEKTSKI